MGLGNFNILNITSKPSATATNIIMAPPSSEHKKEGTLQLRISDDRLQMFKEICEKRGGTMSTVLRNYIDDVIATDGVICRFKNRK